MDSTKGYSTPPRSTRTFEPKANYSQAKLLTSSDLKRRFSPIYSLNNPKKRRHHFLPPTDGLVPSEQQHLKVPVILKQLFADENKENLLSRADHDSIVPYASTHRYPPDYSKCSSSKLQPGPPFSISEKMIKEKFQILFEKR